MSNDDIANTAQDVQEIVACRICHESDSGRGLFSPCKCSGTLAKVHTDCLEQWVRTCRCENCELCGEKYNISTKPQKIIQFLKNPGPGPVRKTLYGDLICLVIVTPLACVAGWLCIWGATGRSSDSESQKIQTFGLIGLTLALFLIYIIWAGMSLRYHLHLWHEWSKQNISIVLTPETPLTTLASTPLNKTNRDSNQTDLPLLSTT